MRWAMLEVKTEGRHAMLSKSNCFLFYIENMTVLFQISFNSESASKEGAKDNYVILPKNTGTV